MNYPTTARPIVALGALLALAACAFQRPPAVPMRAVVDVVPGTTGPRVLLVLLPGRGDDPEDLLRHGMVEMVRQRGIAADVVVADAHVGYYRTRQTVDRLWQDVIAPIHQDYDGVWIAGISLGGLGALLYASGIENREAAAVSGIFSIAPYLGDDGVIEEVAAAGGLPAWNPSPAPEDWSRRLFGWLRGYSDGSAARPAIYVGVGTEDRFLAHTRLLAGLLPEGHVIEVPGAHRWQPWLQIWGLMLDRAPLPRLAPGPG